MVALAATMLAVPVLAVEILPAASSAETNPEAATPLLDQVRASAVQLASAEISSSTTAESTTTTSESTTTTVESTTTTTTAPTTTTAAPTTTQPPTTLPPPPPPPPPAPGVPPDSYWDRMAMCETGGNWAHYPNGTWTGGLGIYNGTWTTWGGSEFAPKAGQATREQQIIVANRIAVTGWNGVAPVGFYAWGCTPKIGGPP